MLCLCSKVIIKLAPSYLQSVRSIVVRTAESPIEEHWVFANIRKECWYRRLWTACCNQWCLALPDLPSVLPFSILHLQFWALRWGCRIRQAAKYTMHSDALSPIFLSWCLLGMCQESCVQCLLPTNLWARWRLWAGVWALFITACLVIPALPTCQLSLPISPRPTLENSL